MSLRDLADQLRSVVELSLSTKAMQIEFNDSIEVINSEWGDFTIFKSRGGLWNTRDSEGNGLCCGCDKEDVIFWSEEHLNGQLRSWTSYPKTSSYVNL